MLEKKGIRTIDKTDVDVLAFIESQRVLSLHIQALRARNPEVNPPPLWSGYDRASASLTTAAELSTQLTEMITQPEAYGDASVKKPPQYDAAGKLIKDVDPNPVEAWAYNNKKWLDLATIISMDMSTPWNPTPLDQVDSLFGLWRNAAAMVENVSSHAFDITPPARLSYKQPTAPLDEFENAFTEMCLVMDWQKIVASGFLKGEAPGEKSAELRTWTRIDRASRMMSIFFAYALAIRTIRIRPFARLFQLPQMEDVMTSELVPELFKYRMAVIKNVASRPVHPLLAEMDSVLLPSREATPWSMSTTVLGLPQFVESRLDDEGGWADIAALFDDVWRYARAIERSYKSFAANSHFNFVGAQRVLGFVDSRPRPKFGVYGPGLDPVYVDGYAASEAGLTLTAALMRPLLPVQIEGATPWIGEDVTTSAYDLWPTNGPMSVRIAIDPEDYEMSDAITHRLANGLVIMPKAEWQGEPIIMEAPNNAVGIAHLWGITPEQVVKRVIDDVNKPAHKREWGRIRPVIKGTALDKVTQAQRSQVSNVALVLADGSIPSTVYRSDEAARRYAAQWVSVPAETGIKILRGFRDGSTVRIFAPNARFDRTPDIPRADYPMDESASAFVKTLAGVLKQ